MQLAIAIIIALLNFLFASRADAQLVEGCVNCRPAFPALPVYVAPYHPPRPVTPPPYPADEIEPKWWSYPGRPGYLFLYQGDTRLLGFWDVAACQYTPYKSADQGGVAWTERKTNIPPLPLPAGYHANAPQPGNVGQPLTGVTREKLSTVERVEINGELGTSQDATAKVELTDDCGLWHVTIASESKAAREKVVSDFKRSPALSPLAKCIRLQAYDMTKKPAREMLAVHRLDIDQQYQQTKFAILIQPPAGKDGKSPVFPLYAYDGPEALARTLETLRAVDPLYDPNKNRAPASVDTLVPAGIALAVGVVLLILAALAANARPDPEAE